MTRTFVCTAAVAALMVATSSAAFAQRIEGKIPFEFTARNVNLPAGKYQVSKLDNSSAGWVMRNVDTGKAVTFLSGATAKVRPADERDKTVLIFLCAGDDCALKSMYTAGQTLGYELPAPRTRVDPKVQIATVRITLAD